MHISLFDSDLVPHIIKRGNHLKKVVEGLIWGIGLALSDPHFCILSRDCFNLSFRCER